MYLRKQYKVYKHIGANLYYFYIPIHKFLPNKAVPSEELKQNSYHFLSSKESWLQNYEVLTYIIIF